YLHLDNRGSPAVVTDDSGNVKKQYHYYAFGELRAQSGAFSTDYSFTGYLKEETGAHYAKMRYYEGGIGRFLRPDPLGALNPYAYCGNDPLNFVDPEGMSKEIAGSMDTGERLEGEGNGFGESFGDWCSGGGPEQEDITNEYMDEIQ
ncbi:RHS repeat-associated core domain-containing protein, partial [candidate division WOR-3 bacterium]|nr:RHS repeat-associated core domain-containing protein [candidate division WOR-3 bacterium]